MAVHAGIDLGSVSVKAALVATDPAEVPLLERLVNDSRFQPIRRVAVEGARPVWLVVAPDTRVSGNPLAGATALIETIRRATNGATAAGMACTGAGAGLIAAEFGLPRVGDFRCLTRAVEALLPGVRTLFEIGGESSKYVRFERLGPADRLGIVDYQANGDCAAGTGAFLDQQAGRLRFRVEEIGEVVLATLRSAPIAGRCSVFAKSDMVHAQQRGFSPGEILSGLCDAVARTFRSSVVRGRPIVPAIGLVGGVAANAGVVRMLEAAFGWDEGAIEVPDEHASFAAVGAALLAGEVSDRPAALTVNGRSPDLASSGDVLPPAPALSMDNVLVLRDRMTAELPADGAPVDAWLGIDVGSVSTNLVVIADDARILKTIYLRTDSRPIEVVEAGLDAIRGTLDGRIRLRGVGTTGSGRDLIGELVGADTVNDEITAHKTGAAFLDRETLGLGVDTIFEIGGQDAKFISLQDGVVVDFAMNDACAAGTGSFLEERARELGIRIDGEFSALALASRAPVRMGERCTVFMERDVNECLRRGVPLADLAAGLAYSVATNYLNRVVRGRSIGEVVFFQGGTAYNDAVAAAFGVLLGRRIVVPPFNGVIGALGAALLARLAMRGRGGRSRFRGLDARQRPHALVEFTCAGCTNACQVQRFTVDGVHTYWGDKCADRYRRNRRPTVEPVIENLIAFRQSALLSAYDPEAGEGPVVGIPYGLSNYEWAPFWFAVFRELGARILLSEPTGSGIARLGFESTVSEPCFPVTVAHGHIRWLLERGADVVLVPNAIAAPGDPAQNPSFFCPWNQTLPLVARAAPHIFERRDRLIMPTLWFNQGTTAVASALHRSLGEAGLRFQARRVVRAVARGFEALEAFRSALVAAGRRALDTLDETGRPGVLLLGRPYNLYDRAVSLDLAAKLRRHYGANVIGFDFLDLPAESLARHRETMFWSYGARLLAAAELARDRPALHVIYVTNFKCGPDSFVKHQVRRLSGRPLLVLEFDGHQNDGGMLTRCEAYLASKGALR